jgi:hypothetical protein
MNSLITEKALFPRDLSNLPSAVLKELANLLKIPNASKSNKNALVPLLLKENQWSHLASTNLSIQEKIFAGRGSVSWHRIDNLPDITKVSECIKKNIGSTDLPYRQTIDIKGEIDEVQVIYVSSPCDEMILFRLLIPVDTISYSIGTEIVNQQGTYIATAILDVRNSTLEVRSDADYIRKIINAITLCIKPDSKSDLIVKLEANSVLGSYGGIEALAQYGLRGVLHTIHSQPSIENDLSEEQIELTLKLIKSVDDFIIQKDRDVLVGELELIIQDNTELLPICQLVIAGIEKIQLSKTQTIERLNNNILYKVLSPAIMPGKAIIHYPFVTRQSIEEKISIRVSFNQNTVYFQGNNTTEEVIKDYKDRIILNVSTNENDDVN